MTGIALSRSSSSSSAGLPTYEGLAPTRPPTTTATSISTISVPGLSKEVQLKVDAGPGCGGIAWPSGEVLSKYLAYRHEQSPSYLYGKTILELGSGTGLVGIVAAMLEPTCEVWITDQDILLDLMEKNAVLNTGETGRIHVAELNWGEEIPTIIPVDETTLILAADCVYFEVGTAAAYSVTWSDPSTNQPAFPLLVKTLCDLAPIGKAIEILFCWKKRRKADKRFFMMLKKHFTSEAVDDDRPGEREVYSREGVSLMRLKRK